MTYEFDGKQYKQASAHQTSWGKELVELLPLKGTERVLDIGCGDGRVTQRLAQRVPNGEVLGIDAADGMILAAKEHESANLRLADIEVDGKNLCDLLIEQKLAEKVIEVPQPEKTNSDSPAVRNESAYIATKSSKVFHRSSCPHTKRIDAAKAVTFSSREDAEKTGRRACKTCKP